MKKIFIFLLTVIIAFIPLSASALTVPMTWKPYDKAYITICFDDNFADLKWFYEIFTEQSDMPLCAAVPVIYMNRNGGTELLHKIENHGGEILSHTKTHKVLNSSVPFSEVEQEFGESYRVLKGEGFNINGIILAGGGGTEDTSLAYRQKLEPYTSKYYKYSDLYGASTQYYKWREAFDGKQLNQVMKILDDTISQKKWTVIYGHQISGFGKENYLAFLKELKKERDAGNIEVVTYKYMYETFGDWKVPVDFGKTKYTVDFYSTDAKTYLASTVVESGSTASVPDGLEFLNNAVLKGWSEDLNNVTDNLKVYALCEYPNGKEVSKTDSPAVRIHKCTFSEKYKSDSDGHWQVCSDCGKANDKSYHSKTSENGKDICIICGYVIGKSTQSQQQNNNSSVAVQSQNPSASVNSDSSNTSQPNAENTQSDESTDQAIESDTKNEGSEKKSSDKFKLLKIAIVAEVVLVVAAAIAVPFIIKKKRTKIKED